MGVDGGRGQEPAPLWDFDSSHFWLLLIFLSGSSCLPILAPGPRPGHSPWGGPSGPVTAPMSLCLAQTAMAGCPLAPRLECPRVTEFGACAPTHKNPFSPSSGGTISPSAAQAKVPGLVLPVSLPYFPHRLDG